MNARYCGYVHQAELRRLKEEDEGSKAAHSDSEDDGRRILIKPNTHTFAYTLLIGASAIVLAGYDISGVIPLRFPRVSIIFALSSVKSEESDVDWSTYIA